MTASAPIIEQTKPVRRLRRWMRFGGSLAIWLVIIVMSLWAGLAIRLANLSRAPPRTFRSLLFAITILSSIIFIRRRAYRFATVAVLILSVVGWYFSISPSNDR